MPQQNVPRLPSGKQRVTVIGRTGTGKTVAGLWHLSNYNLKTKPWVIFNFKNEQHIDDIPNARHIDLDYVPKKKDSGIFILNPTPQDSRKPKAGEQSPVEEYLWKIWSREDCGIFCDEGYMMGDNLGFSSNLTQGRSKKIPMIVCAQRPSWLSRFVFSEADFFQVFDLNDKRDKATIEGFTPLDYSTDPQLEEHQSWYYDVGKNKLHKFNPVPPVPETYDVIEQKTERKRSWL